MVQVIFRQAGSGSEASVEADVGQSLMLAAKAAQVPGIEAACGGSMVCGTCHVYVSDEWFARLPSARAGELELVEFGVDPRATSRLACQIVIGAELEGLVVTVPEAQI
jgi:2Fe-2S ferredoxin